MISEAAGASDRGGRPGIVVITGSGGIGIACARALSSGTVVLADVSEQQLAEASAALRESGVDVETAVCDVSNADSTVALASHVQERGDFQTLVHTAGVSGTLSDTETILRVNLGGTLNVLDAFEPLAAPGAAAVCLSSIGGHQDITRHFDTLLAAPDPLSRLQEAGALGVGSSLAYAIAKRAVMIQCRKRAAAWGSRGGRIVSVSPGLIADTPMGAASLERGPGRPYAQWSAVGRTGRSSEIADVVAFLASPRASFVTGCDIVADGGLLAGIDYHLDVETRASWHACNYSYPIRDAPH